MDQHQVIVLEVETPSESKVSRRSLSWGRRMGHGFQGMHSEKACLWDTPTSISGLQTACSLSTCFYFLAQGSSLIHNWVLPMPCTQCPKILTNDYPCVSPNNELLWYRHLLIDCFFLTFVITKISLSTSFSACMYSQMSSSTMCVMIHIIRCVSVYT